MYWKARRPWGIVAAILGIAVMAIPAWGQRVIAVVEARNALGKPARLAAASVDLDTGAVLPGEHGLPGTALTGPIVLGPGQRSLFLTTGQPWHGGALEARHRESALASFRAAPFDRWPGADDRSTPGWREQAVAVVRDEETLSHLLVTAALNRDGSGTWHGWLQARPWPPEGTVGRVQAAGGVTPLGIAPSLALPLFGGTVLALGPAADGGPVLLQRASPATGTAEPPRAFATGTHPAGPQNLAGAVAAPDAATVWVLFSSLSGEAPTSWLYALDSQTLEPLGPPLEVAGAARAGASHLAADLRGSCWVATRTPGTDFGRVTRAALEGQGSTQTVVQAQTYPLVGVEQRLAVAADIVSGDLLVAVDNTLEYWPGGERAGNRQACEAPITALLWTSAGPVIGEGNRLHRIALPGCAPEVTVALQRGWVAGAAWVPADALPAPDADADGLDDETERRMQTKPENPDSDGDGIPDGSDPRPTAPSPRLAASAEVVFPHTAVGRKLRALQIESLGAPDAQWQIHLDQEALPWLRIHPRNSRGSGYAYMGVDPEHFDPEGVVSGVLEVTLAGKPRGNRPGFTAAYSPATVHIRVEPPRDPLRTILWLWPAEAAGQPFRHASDPQHLRSLGDLAGGYPLYFSMAEHCGPISSPLENYSIVVLTARAAAEGALTQKALFDYLSGGGAVLFLGEHLTGDHFRDLGAWLEPLDVHVEMAAPVQGRFPAGGGEDLLRHWNDFAVEGGCGYAASAPGDVAVPRKSGGQVFVARTHGYGRIALLAAATPLESAALEQEDHRAFALDLLYWLSRAGYAIDDLDGDGLLDGTEDRNDNGAVDEGETHWLDPDTDRDGIPDGMEDTNRNGAVDTGETDPRNADSDGDGTLDSADGTPLG